MAREHFLADVLIRSFEEQEDCDVKFSVDERIIATHKVVLRIRCQTLYDLSSNWTPDKESITIDDIDYDSFKELLRFLYGEAPISNNNVFNFLYGAIHFKMKYLEELCADHFSFDRDNVCAFMEEAINFNCVAVQEKCLHLFSKETGQIMLSQSFKKISQPALSSFLDVNEPNTIEYDLFLGIKQWMEQQCVEAKVAVNGVNMRKIIGDALLKIRFPTMTSQQFANSVSTIDGLLSDREMIQVFKKISVFDNDEIDCPFSSEFRCKDSAFYFRIDNMLKFCDAPIIFDLKKSQFCSLNTVFFNWKDTTDELLNTEALSILLQCCADLANITLTVYQETPTDVDIKKELNRDFTKLHEIVKTKNLKEIMMKFMDMRKKLNKLCKRS